MRILVVGGCGLVGSHVVQALQAQHEVTIFDRRAPVLAPGQIAPCRGLLCVLGDHLDLPALEQAAQGMDAIIHTAGLHSPAKGSGPEVFHANVLGAWNVHEAARRQGVPLVISTSSEAVYGWFFGESLDVPMPHYLPVDEHHPCNPRDAYGQSKLVAEDIAEHFSQAYGLRTRVLRPSWVVTPHDYEVHRGLMAGTAFPLDRFGLFAYVDVRDLAQAYRLAVEADLDGHHIWNVCADDSTSLVPLAWAMLGRPYMDFRHLASGVSNASIKANLGWEPLHSWRTAESGFVRRYRRGNLVRVVKTHPDTAERGRDLVIEGSYEDLHNPSRRHDVAAERCIYAAKHLDGAGGRFAWWHPDEVEFVAAGGEEQIARADKNREERTAHDSDLAWIIAEWPRIRECAPGATACELMRRIGITNPWGARGEGMTYFQNWMVTYAVVDPILSAPGLTIAEAEQRLNDLRISLARKEALTSSRDSAHS